MKNIGTIKMLSERQHGVISRAQLLNHGCDSSSITRLLEEGILSRVAAGIYVGLNRMPTWHQQATIAVMACGVEALLSHESVLIYFGLLPAQYPTRSGRIDDFAPIHIIVPRQKRRTRNVILHETKYLTSEDIYRPSVGIAHVSLARAFIDCSANLKHTDFDFALEKAFQRRLLAPSQLLSALERVPLGRGRRMEYVRETLEPYLQKKTSSGTESILEKRIQRVIEKRIPHTIQSQYPISVNGKSYRLDFAIPELNIAIEVDGFSFHSNRHSFDQDRQRQNDLVGIGWRVLRLTATMNDREIIQAVKRLTDLCV